MVDAATPLPFPTDFFPKFEKTYIPYHGYISVVICTTGVVFGLVNIIVLSRKEMRAPAFILLLACNVSDTILMMEYMLFIISMHFLNFGLAKFGFDRIHRPFFRTYGEAYAFWLQIHVMLFSHIVSLWLRVHVAFFRFKSITFNREWLTAKQTMMMIPMTIIVLVVVYLPITYMISVVPAIDFDVDSGSVIYVYEVYFRDRDVDGLTAKVYIIFFFTLKIMPTFIECVLCYKMTRILIEASKRRRRLKAHGANIPSTDQVDRLTKMLVAIISVNLLLDGIPTTTNHILIGIFGKEFFNQVMAYLQKFLEIMGITSCLAASILVAIMSPQYRATFVRVFGFWKSIPMPVSRKASELKGNTLDASVTATTSVSQPC